MLLWVLCLGQSWRQQHHSRLKMASMVRKATGVGLHPPHTWLLLLLSLACISHTTTYAAAAEVLWVPLRQNSCQTTCGNYNINYQPVRSPEGSQGSVAVCAAQAGEALTVGGKAGASRCSHYRQNSSATRSASANSVRYLCLCTSSRFAASWTASSQVCPPGRKLTYPRICAVSSADNGYSVGYMDRTLGGPSYCRTSSTSATYGFVQLCTVEVGQIHSACSGIPDIQAVNAKAWSEAKCDGKTVCSADCLNGQGNVSVKCTAAGTWSDTLEGTCSGGGGGGGTGQQAGDCRGSWGPYSPCSKPCGGGRQSRRYTVTTPAAPGGRPCPARNGQNQTRACNTQVCPQNCQGTWSVYSRCSERCGGGTQTQTFRVTAPAANGGRPCKFKNGQTRSRACNTQTCATDCVGVWLRPSPCNVTCGTGFQTQQYKITKPATDGGRECNFKDGEVRSTACDTGISCSVDCVGSWTAWGACGEATACGTSTQTSSYIITTPAGPNGTACEAADGATRSQPCDTGRQCVAGLLAVGGSHTCYVNGNLDMKCVGGVNEYSKSVVPGGTSGVKLLGVGPSQSCAVNNQGFACWEGIKAYTSYSIPATFDSSIDAIAVGGVHICGKKGGNLECFGGNGYQQATVPASVNGIVGAAAAGYFHTCVITTANNTVCFGRNDNKQSAVPASLAGRSAAVCAGAEHTCVLASDRSVTCFGNNEFGQVTVPATLAGQQVLALACGYYHNCVVVGSDRSVVCWGNDLYKQSSVPAGTVGVLDVGAGGVHSCALFEGGRITCWGDNAFQQSYV